MKNTGIVRKLDELGRVVLPIETRNKLNMTTGTSLEIYVEGNKVILSKYEPNCTFCQNSKKLVDFMDKKVCTNCIKKLEKKKE